MTLSYLLTNRTVVITLGQFVSHQVISYFTGRERLYRSEEELNYLDRHDLTEQFLNSLGPGTLLGAIPMEDVRDDIAMYIDKMIPKAFVKYRDNFDGAPSKLPDSVINSTNLIYHFRENRGFNGSLST